MALTSMRKKVLGALALSLVLVGGLIAYLNYSLRTLDLSGVVVYKEGVGPGFEEGVN